MFLLVHLVGRLAAIWIDGPAESVVRGHAARANMELGWIALGLVGWGLGLLFTHALFRLSGDQDRDARHEQKRMDPYSDVTITRFGGG